MILIEQLIKQHIPFFQQIESVKKLHKGFSSDVKYVINGKYLIRLFSSTDKEKRKEEFDTIEQLGTFSSYVPQAMAFGTISEMKYSYMILTFLPGEDGEIALPYLTEEEQYLSGITAGKELKKLHQLQAPANYPSWYVVKKEKSNRYLYEFQKLDIDWKIKELVPSFINKHEGWMKEQPNTFQHDDFHPANLLIKERKLSGIIDFQRMDWGDPIHDLHKLGFFSKQVSIPFTRGIIDGYFNHQVNDSFWKLYTLYSAMHIVSSIVWGQKHAGVNYQQMLQYSEEVMEDHDSFNRIIPKWYTIN